MNLFALTNNPAARIVRFPLTQELQAEISAIFAQQFTAFNKGIENVIAFDGRYRPEEGELLAIDDYVDIEGLGMVCITPATARVDA